MEDTEQQNYRFYGDIFGDIVLNVQGHDVHLSKNDLLTMLDMLLDQRDLEEAAPWVASIPST